MAWVPISCSEPPQTQTSLSLCTMVLLPVVLSSAMTPESHMVPGAVACPHQGFPESELGMWPLLLYPAVMPATPICACFCMHTYAHFSMQKCVLTCPAVLHLILGYMKGLLCVCLNTDPVHVGLSPPRIALLCISSWVPNLHSRQRTNTPSCLGLHGCMNTGHASHGHPRASST